MEKLIKVFFGSDLLPYKDKERTVHFPITGSAFLGASNTTKIRFYFDYIGNENITWVSVAKLPNGKQGSKVLSVNEDENGNYAELQLSNWYTQAKGDVFIALQGYQGGVDYTYDSESELYEIHGTPTIQTTGSIKLAINYAPIGQVADYNDEFSTYQQILALLGSKADISSVAIYIGSIEDETYPTYQALFDYVGLRPFIAFYEDKLCMFHFVEHDTDPKTYSIRQVSPYGVFETDTLTMTDSVLPSYDHCLLDTVNCVELSGTAGQLSDIEVERLSQENASIKLSGRYYNKHQQISGGDTIFSNVEAHTSGIGVFRIENRRIVVNLSEKSWNISNISFDTYERDFLEYKFADKSYVDSTFGHTIEMSLDSSNYKVYISLKDKNGTILGQTQVIDLPLETVVVSGSYDSTTKEVVLTLKDGSTIRFSVADLVDGLVSEEQLNVVLANYYNKDAIDDKLDLKADKATTYTKIETDALLNEKQNILVSGQNIKTINNQSLLGSGNINISTKWGDIGGNITDQTDLQNELQNIREVAEGKCKTWVLSYNYTTIGSVYYEYSYYDPIDGEIKNFADALAFRLWKSNANVVNPLFDSQNSSLNIPIEQNDVLIFKTQGRLLLVKTREATMEGDAFNPYKLFHKGDNFYVIETDVPDRWYENISSSGMSFQKLETAKVPLENYATKTELATKSDLTNIAPAYDSTLTYTVGEVVINPNGKLVKANTNISTPEAYDATHWDNVSVASDFVNLTGTQTIGGNKKFSNGITIGDNSVYQDGEIKLYAETGGLTFENEDYPNSFYAINFYYKSIKAGTYNNGTYIGFDLGERLQAFKDLYLSGGINPNSNGYGLTLPNTTSWTANKEIATTEYVDNAVGQLKKTLSIECLAPVGDTTDLSGITIQVKDDSGVVIASGVYNETTLIFSLPLNQKYKVEVVTNSVSVGGITYFAPDKESGQDEGTLTENITLVYRYASTENINSLRAVKQFIAMPDIDLETKRQALVRSETNSFSVNITISNPDNPSQTYTMPLYVLAVDTYTKLVDGVEQSFLGARIQFGYALPYNYVFDQREQVQCDDGETFQSGIYYYTATSSGIGDKAFTPLTEGTDYQVGDSIDTYETTNNVFVFKHAWSNTQYGSGGYSTANLIRYGSNIIHESNLMKWLNGSGTNWFTASHLGDVLASQYVGKHGFKDWFSASDLTLIEDMVGYGVYERANFELPNNKFYSMFNLLSGTEIAGSVNANEGTVFDYWKYLNGGVIGNDANANRTITKIDATTSKQTFWLRSPNRYNSNYVWHANTYGNVSGNTACNSHAVVPTFTV